MNSSLINPARVKRAASACLPTAYGAFALHGYVNPDDGEICTALVMGDVDDSKPMLVRLHSQCLTGDVFHSMRCDCGEQLDLAFRMIAKAGRGIILYLDQEGRGIGLIEKIKAYALQEAGFDTVDANRELGFPPDLRTYEIAGQVLLDLGVRQVRLMSNNPAKRVGLEATGLDVVECVPMRIPPNEMNRSYLKTKREKMGHILEDDNRSSFDPSDIEEMRERIPYDPTSRNPLPLKPYEGKSGKKKNHPDRAKPNRTR